MERHVSALGWQYTNRSEPGGFGSHPKKSHGVFLKNSDFVEGQT